MLDLSDAEGNGLARWINIDTGEWEDEQVLEGGKASILQSPGSVNRAAAITFE